MKKAIFHTENGTGYEELDAHNNEVVDVIRPLTESEADIADVGIMYRCKTKDGLTFDAFSDEITFLVKN